MPVVTWLPHGEVRFGFKTSWVYRAQTQGALGFSWSCLEAGNLSDTNMEPEASLLFSSSKA